MEIYKSITNLKSHPIHDANGIRDTSGEQIYICITNFVRRAFLRYSVPREQWKQINKQCVKNFEYRLINRLSFCSINILKVGGKPGYGLPGVFIFLHNVLKNASHYKQAASNTIFEQ